MGSEPSVVENLAPAETSVAAVRPDSVIPPDVVGEILEDCVQGSDPDFRLTLRGDDHTSHIDTHHPTVGTSTPPPSPTGIWLCKRLKAPLMTNCQTPC